MIRITGGQWRGRKLRTPAGLRTRPTAARVREALFNILGTATRQGPFYDLFAGSGAVGIEALSRGAPEAIFVEPSRPAMAALSANLRLLECEEQAQSVTARLPGWLGSVAFRPPAPSTFFLDPPYDQSLAEATLEALGAALHDFSASLCVAQTEKNAALSDVYGPWRLRKRYAHGDTALWLFDGLAPA